MQDLKAELLRGLWYVALPSAELRPGRMVHKTLLGITATSTATPSRAAITAGAST